MSPLVRLRALVARWRTAQAEARRARALEEPSDPRTLAAARAALGTGEARSLLDECTSLGITDAVDRRVFAHHLADAAREELASRRGSPPPFVASDEVEVVDERVPFARLVAEHSRWTERSRLDGALAAVAERAVRWREVHEEADALAARIEARAPASEELPLSISDWLDATDDATSEALARSQHAVGLTGVRGIGAEASVATARTLRAALLDALVARPGRIARLGRALEPLGTDAMVASRLRTSEDVVVASASEVVLLEPPRRVLVLLSPHELGVASELDGLDALGRALSFARSSPALGDEHRMLPRAEVPALVGALFAQFLAEPRFAERCLGIEGRGARALATVAGYLELVRARLDIGRAMVRARGLSLASEEAHALAARAIGLASALPLGFLLASNETTPVLELRARSRAWAPALFMALRERHDEELFRNPRTADTLGGAMARGARLDRAAWLRELSSATDAIESARTLARERLG